MTSRYTLRNKISNPIVTVSNRPAPHILEGHNVVFTEAPANGEQIEVERRYSVLHSDNGNRKARRAELAQQRRQMRGKW